MPNHNIYINCMKLQTFSTYQNNTIGGTLILTWVKQTLIIYFPIYFIVFEEPNIRPNISLVMKYDPDPEVEKCIRTLYLQYFFKFPLHTWLPLAWLTFCLYYTLYQEENYTRLESSQWVETDK